jgi:hypothetical protein
MLMKVLVLAALLLMPLAGMAQIYKTTDEYGNVSYSDTAPASGPSEEIKLREINSTPAPDLPAPEPESFDNPDEALAAPDYKVAISAPANETTIPMGPGNFSVSASVQPPLGPGDSLQRYIDGTPSGSAQSGPNWSLTNVFRGAHDITVSVIDENGTELASSAPLRVYVLRPSINFKHRK